MLSNYLKLAWRHLLKNKGYSFINIFGLAFGMAIFMMIALWLYDELSFNRSFENYNRIAQVIQNVTNNNEVETWNNVPFPLADELRKNYASDFKNIVMSDRIDDHTITINNKKLKSTGAFFEKGFGEMFSLKMITGDYTSIENATSVILSQSAAKAFFGDKNPIDQIIQIDDLPVTKVEGVFIDFPPNSTFAGLDFISSWNLLYNNTEWMRTFENPWRPNFTNLYVQLNDNIDIDKASANIKNAKLNAVNAQLAAKKPELFLHPISKWHLYSQFKNGVNTGGAIQYVWMFGLIGLFVLLLACINFINLSTARSEKRAKEVGIRKTVGSLRNQIILQFFSESFLTVLLSHFICIILVKLALPWFNHISDKHMSILWTSPYFWIAGIALLFFTTLSAGSYPALYLSSFKPMQVLKGTFIRSQFTALPRQLLVILQFTISITLIIGTSIVYKQILFAKNRPVGYTREGLINIINPNSNLSNHSEAFSQELIRNGAIVSMATSSSPTTGTWGSTSGLNWEGKDPNLSIDFANIGTSYDYGKTVGWLIKEGRDFSRDFGTDSNAIIINEAAVNFIGLKDIVGKTITWWDEPFHIVGIVKNMIMNSPYNEPRPTVFNLTKNRVDNVVLVRLNPSISVKDALAKIEPTYKKFNPDEPFSFWFADNAYASKFENEERIGNLATCFAVLAIFISCLGLFGLTSFVAEQRNKEIGIRKVLGASAINLWGMLSKDFIKLVMISCVIATPIAYYILNNWLQNYNYRTDITWWIFAAPALGAILITLATVSLQSVKVAMSNPIKSLRTE
ncbi:MAG: ABC transporter permease [Saprospiraceae bacterium]